MDVQKILSEDATLVDQALERYLPDSGGLNGKVCEAMRYSLTAGGKRIRPVLTIEFARLCGKKPKTVMNFACAIEMVHTYSLIHDDLPCMDNDDIRRGRPSCHVKYGEATAMLAGDALLSLAFETALCAPEDVAPGDALAAAKLLAQASGAAGMVGGQIIDLESEGRNITLETLEFMHSKKTGAMIMAAAQMGCIASGAGSDVTESAGEYAKRLGLAFQIVDDILDVTGDGSKLGKPIGSDKENHKTTYITHLGLDKSRQLVRKLTQEAVRYIDPFGEKGSFLAGLADYLASRDR